MQQQRIDIVLTRRMIDQRGQAGGPIGADFRRIASTRQGSRCRHRRARCNAHPRALRAHGADIIVTRQTVTDEAGEIVQETYTTLAGRAGEGDDDGGFANGVA